ncbi:hypothetical protein [Psychrobacter fjordensis]|uniref:hypothetical protein n=1 Tax=Psychrobacter fjordensis TaxID=664424 RepID=UPI0019193E95|nr:hypothetical protein [Psychrobacter fjordensis]
MASFNLDEHETMRKLFNSTTSLLVLNTIVLVIGGVFVASCNETLRAVGTSLIASSLVSFSTLWVRFIKTSEDRLLSNIRSYGLKEIHSQRALVSIYEKLLETSNEIDVTGYSLSGFSNQALDIIKKRNAGENPINVRILLVDPKTEASKSQALNEGHIKDYYQTLCTNILASFEGIENVEIRFIEQSLPVMIYRLGDILFTGHYSIIKRSRSSSTVTYEIKKPGRLFDMYLSEFEEMWYIANKKDTSC